MFKSIFNRKLLTIALFLGLLIVFKQVEAAYITSGNTQWLNNASNIYYDLGNVGIGTTAPGYNLDLESSANPIIRIHQSVTNAGVPGLYLDGSRTTTGNVGQIFFFNNLDSVAAVTAPWIANDAADLRFSTQATGGSLTERMTINSLGNVGIGITNPGTRLTVVGSGSYSIDASNYKIGNVATPTTNTDAANKAYVDSTIPSMIPDQLWSGTLNGNIWNGAAGVGNVGIGTTNPTNKLSIQGITASDAAPPPVNLSLRATYGTGTSQHGIGFYVNTGNYLNSGIFAPPGALSFFTSSSWTTLDAVERMRINSIGNVGIGLTNPSERLAVNGNILASGGTVSAVNFHDANGVYNVNLGGNNGRGLAAGYSGGSYGGIGYNIRHTATSAQYIAPGADTVSYLLFTGGGFRFYGAPVGTAGRTVSLSELMYISPAGNVGIGITPSYKLHVNGTALFTQPVTVGTPTAAAHAATKSYVDATIPTMIPDQLWSGTLNGNIWNGNSGVGNVGVGTTAPAGKLEIKQAMSDYTNSFTAPHLKLGTTNTVDNTGFVGITFDASTSPNYGWSIGAVRSTNGIADFVWKNHQNSATGNELLRITSTGSVGIGTTNPGAYKLFVNGNTNISGTIQGSTLTDGIVTWNSAQFNRTSGNIEMQWSGSGNNGVRLFGNTAYPIIFTGSGNIGVGLTNPAVKLDVAGGINLTDRQYTLSGNVRTFDNVAQYYNGSTPTAGTIAVTIANTPNIMLEAEIVIQGYQGLTTCRVRGYTYTGSTTWHMPAATCLGSGTDGKYTVRFAKRISDNARVILIGNTSSNWGNYIHAAVTRVTFGYPGSGDSIGNWSIAVITDESPYTSITDVDENLGFSATNPIFFGNVGIGITNPGTRLTVVGSGNYSIDASSYKIGNVATPTVATDAANKGYVDSAIPASLWSGTLNGNIWNGAAGAGNVGIGTTAPGFKLDVAVSGDGDGVNIVNYTSNGSIQSAGFQLKNNLGGQGSFFKLYSENTGVSALNNLLYAKNSVGGISFLANTGSSIGFGVGTAVADASDLVISSTGNVGIGTTTPGSKLHVVGNANITSTLTMGGDINMANNNITAINKLTVNTIDPLYNIKGINYSTFAPSMVGGVKEEYVGLAKIDQRLKTGEYEKIINFDQVAEGSDLWVWHKTIDFSPNNVQVIITPIAQFANTYYFIEDDKLVLRADKEVEVSYRLTGNRHDWKEWPTRALDQTEKAGFIID